MFIFFSFFFGLIGFIFSIELLASVCVLGSPKNVLCAFVCSEGTDDLKCFFLKLNFLSELFLLRYFRHCYTFESLGR